MRTPVKNFRISVQGFFHVPETPDFGTVDSGVCVIELQVKRHNFPRFESFRGLAHIPTMCLLYLTFAGGVPFWRYKLPKKPCPCSPVVKTPGCHVQ